MGCAECRALRVYRDIDSMQRIVGVDIDRQLLVDSTNHLSPVVSDYLFRRSKPLTVELYRGSLVDRDQRLKSIEAVTLIEVFVCIILCVTVCCFLISNFKFKFCYLHLQSHFLNLCF